MANIVFDASSIVGALLKPDSVPERALLLARARHVICLSDAVEGEIREVLGRPRFTRYLGEGRGERVMDLVASAAGRFSPSVVVQDCRDAKDNKYLELALAAGAAAIVSSDNDLLVLDSWRGIRIVTPAQFLELHFA
jgi:putative PIN family toxin of toxin-antitoxin system